MNNNDSIDKITRDVLWCIQSTMQLKGISKEFMDEFDGICANILFDVVNGDRESATKKMQSDLKLKLSCIHSMCFSLCRYIERACKDGEAKNEQKI